MERPFEKSFTGPNIANKNKNKNKDVSWLTPKYSDDSRGVEMKEYICTNHNTASSSTNDRLAC